MKKSLVWVGLVCCALFPNARLPAREHSNGDKPRDVIQWFSRACSGAGDLGELRKAERVASKAIIKWIKDGKYREAVELALSYLDCLKNPEPGVLAILRNLKVAFLHEVTCYVTLGVFEAEHGVDLRFARKALLHCPSPGLEVPTSEKQKAEWAERVRRYMHLMAAASNPKQVARQAAKYYAAMMKAGFRPVLSKETPEKKGGKHEKGAKGPDPVFAVALIGASAAIGSGDLDTLLRFFGTEEKACSSPLLLALALTGKLGPRVGGALPIVIAAMMDRTSPGEVARLVRLIEERFKGKKCGLPWAVAAFGVAAVSDEEADRLALEGRLAPLVTLLERGGAGVGLPGSYPTKKALVQAILASPKVTSKGKGEWLCGLGEAALRQGKILEAYGHFSRALKMLPSDSRQCALAGKVVSLCRKGGSRPSGELLDALQALLRGKLDAHDLVSLFDRVVEGSGKALLAEGLGKAARGLGDLQKTQTVWRALVFLLDRNAGARWLAAIERTAKGLEVTVPDRERCGHEMVLARHHLKLHQKGRAKQALDEAMRILEKKPGACKQSLEAMVLWLATEKEYVLVDHLLRNRTTRHAMDTRVLADLAGLLAERGQHKQAVRVLRWVRATNPTDRKVWLALAGAYASLDMADEALDALKRSAPEEKWGEDEWITRGRIEMSRGRFKEAARAFERAVNSSSGDPQAYYFRGLAKLVLGAPEDAAEDFQKCIELGDVQDDAVLGALAYSLLDQGRYEEAVKRFKAALKIKEGSADNHMGLAMALWRLGRKRDALEHYSKALSLDPVMRKGYAAAEKAGYIYSAIQKKVWDEMAAAARKRRHLR